MRILKIILLSSTFNGLTQRTWLMLRELGHQPSVLLFTNTNDVCQHISASGADLVICPFLKQRVPTELWHNSNPPVIIIHPGIVGDRGASSLDWAISQSKSRWGVTALEAVEEMDAGPIWSTYEFDVPSSIRKSELYNEQISDAALHCIKDVVKKFNHGFTPIRLEQYPHSLVKGRLQPSMKQADRVFEWTDTAANIKRKIDAADGFPGVLAFLAGEPYYFYDAHLDQYSGLPGQLLAVHDDAVLVGTGKGSLWIGSLKHHAGSSIETFKQPARHVLREQLKEVPHWEWSPETQPHCAESYQPIRYRQIGVIGELTFEFYNGAMSTEQCRRLLAALRWAKQQATLALIVKGGRGSFSNGIHLNVIQAATHPGEEAWRNIEAIDDVCYELLSANQLAIAGVTGNAGAGGVMLALAADVVFAREGIVFNPHYQTMGLYGSEYWTYVLPRAVGDSMAAQLASECLPISTCQALAIGLIQDIGPRNIEDFSIWLLEAANNALTEKSYSKQRIRKTKIDFQYIQRSRELELAEMYQDMLGNRRQFIEKCANFVFKRKICQTPQRLISPWALKSNLLFTGTDEQMK